MLNYLFFSQRNGVLLPIEQEDSLLSNFDAPRSRDGESRTVQLSASFNDFIVETQRLAPMVILHINIMLYQYEIILMTLIMFLLFSAPIHIRF